MARARAQRKPKRDLSHLPLDGIIRVSRVAGRDIESERYHTEEYQEERIREVLAQRGRELGNLYVERDVSGKAKNRKLLNEAMDRVRLGVSGGICVAYLSRFGRSAGQTILNINELNDLGATFISADGQFDTSTKEGRAWAGFMSILADMEWERIRENWETVVGRAIAQGRYVAGVAPVGYVMGESGRLELDPITAPHIRQVFSYRAEGWSWTRLCDYLDENEVVPPSAKLKERYKRGDRNGWSRTTVAGVIKNVAYMGWARQQGDEYDFVNREAHPAIVEEPLWRLAQSADADGRGERTGELSSQALVRGLAVCKNCGYRLLVRGRTIKKTGSRVPMYCCDRRHATGYCDKPANIDHRKLDPYVETMFVDHVATRIGAKKIEVEDPAKLAELQAALDAAEKMLGFWMSDADGIVEDLGGDDEAFQNYRRQLVSKREARDDAREKLVQERSRQTLVNEMFSGDLLDRWDDLSHDHKRRLLRAAIDRIEINCAEGQRGWKAPPVEERATIIWHSGV